MKDKEEKKSNTISNKINPLPDDMVRKMFEAQIKGGAKKHE